MKMSVTKTGPVSVSRDTPPTRKKLLLVWDIENCQVPKGISASTVVKKIRDLQFLKSYTEYRFVVACDVTKLKKTIRIEIFDSQVEMLHVESTSKNAADSVLKLQLQNFGCNYSCMGAAVLLISSDVNFAPEIADLRNKRKVYVILLHKSKVSEALTQHSDKHYDIDQIIKDLPARVKVQAKMKQRKRPLVRIRGVPKLRISEEMKRGLEKISDNCGGKVNSLTKGAAVMAFHDDTAAERAAVRMHNEIVCKSKIKVEDYSSDTFKVDTSDSESSDDDIDDLAVAKTTSKKQAYVPKVCRTCKVQEIAFINLPCQHATVCRDCATEVITCSVCHKSIKGTKPMADN